VTTALGDPGDTSEVHGLAIDSAGDILAGGYIASFPARMTLVRYTSDGELDAGFGVNGIALTPSDSAATGLTLDATGHVTLAGYSESTSWGFALARFEN
jgi:hypothetical protein